MFKVLLAKLRGVGKTPVSSFSTTQQTFKSYPKQRDHIIRGFTKNGHVRFSIVDCSTAVNTSIGEERVKSILSYVSNDKINTSYAESMANGEIRGFAKNEVLNPEKKHDSLLSVARVLYDQSSEFSSMIQLKENFDGSTEKTRDLIHEYFETSEQIPTVGNLHFEKENNNEGLISLGYLIQVMPGCPENYLNEVQQKYFEKTVWPEIIQNKTIDINNLQSTLNNLNLDVQLTRYPVDFHCRCKKEDYIKVLKTINVQVIFEMKDNNENELHCLYCNKTHVLEKEDFEDIIKDKSEAQKIETN